MIILEQISRQMAANAQAIHALLQTIADEQAQWQPGPDVYLHLRQMNELLHAWNVKQAAPYSVEYAGGWS